MQEGKKSALEILQQTSRTFFIPITRLPSICQEAVTSAYLALRAIDQVEDHSKLENAIKAKILRGISYELQKYRQGMEADDLKFDWYGIKDELPEVTLRLGEWIMYCPREIRARVVVDSTCSMADRMAFWAERNWRIDDESDLDAYTFTASGAVGLMLCEIWEWYEGTKTDRDLAIGYGRAIQSINILLNSKDDSERGVTFYPPGWQESDLMKYCRKNLMLAKEYMKTLKEGTAAYIFCEMPLALADASLTVKENGMPKLTREQVKQICKIP